MKITVEFLSLPNVVKIVGGKALDVELRGRTVSDLVNELVGRFGPKLGAFLLDESGALDMVFRVVLNQGEWLPREQLDRTLQDGDRVALTMLVGGG